MAREGSFPSVSPVDKTQGESCNMEAQEKLWRRNWKCLGVKLSSYPTHPPVE